MSILAKARAAQGAGSSSKDSVSFEHIILALEQNDETISDTALAALITYATRCYVQRLQQGRHFSPFHPDVEITATEAMILSTEVLKSADLQLFELGMWQAMGSPT